MEKNTQRKPHIDTLTVVYGYAFVIEAIETIALGKRPGTGREDEPSPWLYYPAGRGA